MTGPLAIPAALLARARAICLALPETTEQETWGHPTFRVRGKIFAGIGVDDDFDPEAGTGAGRVNMTMKAAPGTQEILLATGEPFFRPRYVGSKGWIGVLITDSTDWDEVAELVRDSYVAIAPKTLARQLAG